MGYSRNFISPSKQIEVADNILDEVFLIMKQLKIKTFLVFGVCLGFIRDGGYIQGDRDIDLGIIYNWKKGFKYLIKVFQTNGFMRRRVVHKSKHLFLLKNKVCVDIWFFSGHEEFYSKFDYVWYKKKEYPVPHPAGEYLNRCYSNWKVKENESTHYYRSFIPNSPCKPYLNINVGIRVELPKVPMKASRLKDD